MSAMFGLCDRDKQRLPLKEFKTTYTMLYAAVSARATLSFENPHGSLENVTFAFPLLPEATVFGMKATLDGRTVRGEVKSKQEARSMYDSAVRSGHVAALVEKPAGDVMRLNLGALEGQEATVVIDFSFVCRQAGEGELRLALPAVGHRYPLSSGPISSDALDEIAAVSEACGAGRDAAFRVTVELQMPSVIVALTSPTHEKWLSEDEPRMKTVIDDVDRSKGRVVLHSTSVPGEEIVVLVKLSKAPARCWIEPGAEGGAAALLAIHPEVVYGSLKCAPCASQGREYFVVVDRSGSMHPHIDATRAAVHLCVASLPVECYFQIIGFGSEHKSLFSEPVPYDEANVAIAKAYAAELKADMEGTELLEVFEAVISQPHPERKRRVILLTDGQVSNAELVFELARRGAASGMRISTIGLGPTVSHSLVEEVAKKGKGTCEFVADGEQLAGALVRLLKQAMAPAPPCIEGIEFMGCDRVDAGIDGEGWVDAFAELQVKDSTETRCCIESNGGLVVVAAILDKPAESCRVRFRYSEKQGTLDVPLERAPDGRTIHAAAGRVVVEEMYRAGSTAKGVEVAIRLQLVTKHTSMVAVGELPSWIGERLADLDIAGAGDGATQFAYRSLSWPGAGVEGSYCSLHGGAAGAPRSAETFGAARPSGAAKVPKLGEDQMALRNAGDECAQVYRMQKHNGSWEELPFFLKEHLALLESGLRSEAWPTVLAATFLELNQTQELLNLIIDKAKCWLLRWLSEDVIDTMKKTARLCLENPASEAAAAEVAPADERGASLAERAAA